MPKTTDMKILKSAYERTLNGGRSQLSARKLAGSVQKLRMREKSRQCKRITVSVLQSAPTFLAPFNIPVAEKFRNLLQSADCSLIHARRFGGISEGTAQWIFDRKEFVEWMSLDEPAGKLLWCYGNGKVHLYAESMPLSNTLS